jgi:tRNA(Ile)-lysidine synthase
MRELTVEEAVAAYVARYGKRRKRLIAVSGGRDSVALLCALHELGVRPIVCHLDHQLRGVAAKRDADFVVKLAERLGLACEAASADVGAIAQAEKLSIETTGRMLRHEYFGDCARRHRCREVVLAHHADDQVETILMNLARGASGLRGMAESHDIAVPPHGRRLTFHRPLLQVSRAAIDRYLAQRKLKYREDASNATTNALRNRVRLRLVPVLQDIAGRDVRPALLRAAAIAEEEDEFLNYLAAPWAGHDRLPVAVLRAEPLAMQRRIIHRWLCEHGVPDCGYAEVCAVVEMLAPEHSGARVNLPRDVHVRRTRGELWLEEPLNRKTLKS